MKTRKIISALLTICMLGACLGLPAFAQEDSCPVIGLDETVTFDVTPDDHVRYYSFTAAQDGQVVLYGVGDSPEMDTLSVHSVSPETPEFEEQILSSGYGRVALNAVAGATYWFRLDCWCPGADPVTHSFRLAAPVEPERLELDYTPGSGFLGEEGDIGLRIYPLNAGGEILWSSSDENVVQVTGHGAGARYQLVGEGTATVTATAANGCTASVEITATEKLVISSGEDKELLIEGREGNYHSVSKTFWFTPEVTDLYSFSVQYNEEQHVNHNLQMTVRTGSGEIYHHKNLLFQAEAGVEYAIELDFWGNYDTDARYLFSLRPCVTGEGFQLEAVPSSGFKGSFLQILVQWDSVNSRPEELIWSSSDEQIATIESGDWQSTTVNLLAPGTATITATNGAGLSASVDVVVLEALDLLVLEPGKSCGLALPAGGSAQIAFTPEQTGYYYLELDQEGLSGWLEGADSVSENGRTLYHLQAGQTYYGYVENSAATVTEGNVNVVMSELRRVTAMEITRLPDNTTYLAGALEDLWTYQVLAGMQMEITWSDGTTESWSFDREGPYVGREDLTWEVATGEEQTQLVLRCGQATVSCPLTVLNLTVTEIRLKDASPLELAEHSCGIALEDGSWYYVPYQAHLRELEIVFNDGTTISARANEMVYGNMVLMEDFQSDVPWAKDAEQYLQFSYMEHTAQLPVQIIDSPVECIELTKLPADTFLLGDESLFSGTAGRYFFEPQNLRDILRGLEFKVVYRDGSTEVVTEEQLEWVEVEDTLWPFYNGCPLGLFSKLYADQYPITGPGDHEGVIEYMGAEAVYTIHFVNELPQPPVEPIPPTADVDLTPVLMLLGLLACAVALISRKKYK